MKYEKRQQVIGTTSSFFSFEKSHKFIVSYKPLCLFDLYLRTFWLCFDSNSNTEKSSSRGLCCLRMTISVYYDDCHLWQWWHICDSLDWISNKASNFFIARTVAVKKSTQLNFWNDLQSHIVHTFLWLLDLVFFNREINVRQVGLETRNQAFVFFRCQHALNFE